MSTRTLSDRMQSFFVELDRYQERVPLDKLTGLMRKMDITVDDVQHYIHFSDEQYQRNLMREGRAYQALVLCWKNGQRSPIHDHPGSSCGMKILKGVATEIVFDRGTDGMLKEVATNRLAEGEICGSQDADIHEVINDQPEGRELITLHIYSPPLLKMNTYSRTSPTVRTYYDPINEFTMGAGI